MKIIALYLPQYHAIKENDEWWGKNYTEWDSLKRGSKLIENQYQPRIPMDQYYYDLSNINVMRWQVKIAKEYGIYGFCVYHYWFNGKLLLEKPMEQFLRCSDIDFPYCFCWANEDWSNIWSGDTKNLKILMQNCYNDKKDWYAHFYYLLPFFKDNRYMKEDNKPVFVLYNPLLINNLDDIVSCWDYLAIKNGFLGIKFIYQCARFYVSDDKRKKSFDYGFQYFPGLLEVIDQDKNYIKFNNYKHQIASKIRSIFGMSILNRKIKDNSNVNGKIRIVEDYDEQWKRILSIKPENDFIIPGAFTDWDNTPRRKYNGKVILGSTPEKFEKYLSEQIRRAINIYKKDVIFIFAWNEWSEGGYLEPDEKYGFGYLEAIKNALLENNEFPDYSSNNDKLFTR